MRLLVSCISRLAIALVLLALLAPRWPSTLHAAEQRVADPKELPRFPPVAAGDALNTFQLRKGFRLELVAAEPLVTDPIALAFDEDGRLFVVEMNDYPERGEQLLGQALSDRDGVVREHAVRLSEGLLQDSVPSLELWKKLSACASDSVVGVRYQLAFSLGEIRHPERLGVLAQIARRDAAEPMMRAAVLSSLTEGAGEMFSLLADETGVPATATGEILRELAA